MHYALMATKFVCAAGPDIPVLLGLFGQWPNS
jgi:hypothetical protein